MYVYVAVITKVFGQILLLFLKETSPKAGGWREREKAREESWGPPRNSGTRDDDDGENDEDENREGERFRERRPPPRYSCDPHKFGVWFSIKVK